MSDPITDELAKLFVELRECETAGDNYRQGGYYLVESELMERVFAELLRIQSARKDAGRYKYLREKVGQYTSVSAVIEFSFTHDQLREGVEPHHLDAAIDAAMAGEGG